MRVIVGCLFVLWLAPQPALAQRLFDDGLRELADQIAAGMGKAQKRKIAVAALSDLSAGQVTVLSIALAEELTTRLVNAPGLEVVERAMLDKVMAELKLGSSGAIDPGTAKQVGKVAGVDAIVTGTITDAQSTVSVNLRVIDVETGRIFAAAQTRLVKDDDLRAIMRPAGSRAAAPVASAPARGGIGGAPVPSAAPAARRDDVTFSSPTCRFGRQAQRGDDGSIAILAARDFGTVVPRVRTQTRSFGSAQAPAPRPARAAADDVSCELLITNESARALPMSLCGSYLVDSTGRRSQSRQFDFAGQGRCDATLEPGVPQRFVLSADDLGVNARMTGVASESALTVTVVLIDLLGSFQGSVTLQAVVR